MLDPNEIPDWCVANIAAVAAWMKEQGCECWMINGIGPVPNRVVLHGKTTVPNWFFIAERQELVP